MVAKIARCLPIVPFEFIVPHSILVCRIAGEDKANPIGLNNIWLYDRIGFRVRSAANAPASDSARKHASDA